MPSQNPVESDLKYTTAPLIIWEVLSYARLQPLQSQLLNHFILHSLNVFGKKQNINARKWVPLHTNEFSIDKNCSRQGVQEAANMLVGFGFLEAQETLVRTNSGQQKGREFRIVSNQKLKELLDVLKSSIKPQGAKYSLAPENVDNSTGDRPDLAPRQAPLGTLTGPAWHLVRPHLAPHGVLLNDFNKMRGGKYSLKTFKDFLNTFSDFQNSFYELYAGEANSKTSQFKIKMEIAALIRQYGLFSVFIAMSINLFLKDAVIGDFEAINAFLVLNKIKLREQEEKLHAHSVDLFNSILKIHSEIEFQDLEIFKENFRQNASVLLIKEEIEQSSIKLFFYSSFQKDVVDIFETCNFNLDRFTSEVLKKINLYFKFKILGMKNGLNFVQSEEY